MRIARTIAALALAAGLLGASSAVSAGASPTPEPYCPTEDSCTADYRDGGWVISEVTP